MAVGYQPPESSAVDSTANASIVPSIALSQDDSAAPSVDQLVAVRVAADIAERTELPVARNIANLSTTLSIESQLAQVDDNSISKPQIVQPTAGSREIRTYTVVAGDTVSKLAARFGVSADTIKWSNDLTSDSLEVGKKLKILPIDGVIYTAKSDDTVKSIADRYKTDEKRIVAYNDLELSGLKAGQRLILPDGNLPNTERPGYVAPVQQPSFSYTPVRYGVGFAGSRTWTIGYGTAANKYAYGNCTAYAFNRRVQLGKPVGAFWGHAASWAARAQAEGLSVNNVPSVGAILQNGGGYGHVGIVEEILPNGDVSISEMNAYVPGGGFNVVSGRIIPAANVSSYNYIH